MSIPLFVRPEAVADLQEAFEWYEKRAPGLGAQLVGELDRALASIAANPLAFSKIHRAMRRTLLRRFPYGVFYLVEDDRIVVLAILHTARHPRLAHRRDGGAPGTSGQ
jgi:toxin ParE1/3/4